MSLSLKNLKTVRADTAPRILIYGPPGIGKTTLASEFPDPVFIQVEDGTPGDVELTSFGRIETFGEVMDALGSLYADDHTYRTVVIDSVTELQRLIFAETCARGDEKGNRKANIEDFGYGKGYVYSQRIWSEFLDGINYLRRDKNMCVVLIAHSKIERFDDPETVSYDRYEIDMHGKSVGIIEREMDAILLLKQPVTVKTEDVGFNKERALAAGGGTTLINAIGKPAFTAKNRYGIPASLRYDRGQGFLALEPYFPPFAATGNQATVNKEAA